jgi:hypothetical protein
MSIRIDDNKRKALKVIASIEGKSMGGIVSELIEEYITANKDKFKGLLEKEDLVALMKISEQSFKEWDNDEDSVYDEL